MILIKVSIDYILIIFKLACKNNIYLATDSVLVCDGGVMISVNDQLDENGNDKPLNDPSYFNAEAISCSGCSSIRSVTCDGPVVPAWFIDI